MSCQWNNIVTAKLSLLNLHIDVKLHVISLKHVNWSYRKATNLPGTNYILNFTNGHLCMGTEKRPKVWSQSRTCSSNKNVDAERSVTVFTLRTDFGEWKNYAFYIRRLFPYISHTHTHTCNRLNPNVAYFKITLNTFLT